jgi:transposase
MRYRRYPSDLTDAQWALVASHIPSARAGGRPRTTDVRAVLDAIIYLLRAGCQWRQLPSDFPPWSTVHGYFRGWRMAGVWVLLHRALYPLARLAAGRKSDPTVVIMDGQSVKTAEQGGVRGFDGHKRVKGRKRHILVDVLGPPIASRVESANISDRRAGGRLFAGLAPLWPPFALSLQMMAMRVASSLGSCDAMGGVCKSSSVNSEPSRSLVSPGLLNAASPGVASIAACRKTTSAMSKRQKHCW